MAFKLSDLDSGIKECEVQYGEYTLHFKYRQMAYTPNHEDAVEEAIRLNKVGSTYKAMLLPLLTWWDVVEEVPKTNDNGEPVFKAGKPVMVDSPVPITEEGLGRVPLRVLGDINRAINADMMPGEASSTSSEGSFS